MVVVSNTSPISNLALIGRLSLIHEQFGIVHIPAAVQKELTRLPNATARGQIDAAIRAGTLIVQSISGRVPAELSSRLDAGEAEALVLAKELNAAMVLLDETSARSEARRLGLEHTGVLGVLVRARKTGRIDALHDEIRKLREEARFFIGTKLEHALLISVGEKK
jgi:predicted nucleic acid-binding protein